LLLDHDRQLAGDLTEQALLLGDRSLGVSLVLDQLHALLGDLSPGCVEPIQQLTVVGIHDRGVLERTDRSNTLVALKSSEEFTSVLW